MTPNRYTTVAIWLHWIIALLIIVNLALGFGREWVERDVAGQLMWFHRPIGLTVLLLSVARLVWRLLHSVPGYAETTPPWQAFFARAVHWGFYLLIIAMPLVGWLIVSTGRAPTGIDVFGLFNWPVLPIDLGADRAAVHGGLKEVHEYGGYLILGLLALHIGAVLKHIFIDRDDVAARMLPFAGWRRREIV